VGHGGSYGWYGDGLGGGREEVAEGCGQQETLTFKEEA
jgi:hypothetical protein